MRYFSATLTVSPTHAAMVMDIPETELYDLFGSGHVAFTLTRTVGRLTISPVPTAAQTRTTVQAILDTAPPWCPYTGCP